jgi:hypothetical protein
VVTKPAMIISDSMIILKVLLIQASSIIRIMLQITLNQITATMEMEVITTREATFDSRPYFYPVLMGGLVSSGMVGARGALIGNMS